MNELEACRLWRRAGFGADGATLRRTAAQGYEATVFELLDWSGAATSEPPPTTALPPGLMLTLLQISSVIRWWLDEMIATAWPLREKMVLFWHGHFTTSADPVFSAGLLLRQNQMFRDNALGRFEDMLRQVADDPAMLVYLDGERNVKSHPNENFARELLELFTIGVGNYDENDVKAAARAFTGWSLEGLDRHVEYHADRHDDGQKTFLGKTGAWDADAVIHMLATHPLTARRLCSRLYRFLTGQTAPPPEVERLAAVFAETHGNMGAVLRSLLLGQAFRHAPPGYRSPVEWLVGALRLTGGRVHAFGWIDPLRLMGQLPFVPPSVKGWEEGPAWINTATLLERLNFAPRLAGDGHPLQGLVDARSALFALGLPEAGEATRHALQTAADAAPDQAARRMLTLAISSPEFQMK